MILSWTRAILLPLALFLAAYFLAPEATKAAAFIALPWYFLIERKGYTLLANVSLLSASIIFLVLEPDAFALILALLPLALAALLLPGRHESREKWVLSMDPREAFIYRFDKNKNKA